MGLAGDWGFALSNYKIVALIAALVIGFILGAAIATRLDWLRRLFTPRDQMREEVAARACEVFFDKRVHRTAGGTGLLVYVSLFERMAAILGDEIILKSLGQEALDELCSQLTRRLRTGDPAEAIGGTILRAGERLALVLPRAPDDTDELPNQLVLLD